jgi:SAM-dependent methyltransferase
MSGFSADWLALRESADAAARSVELAKAFGRALPRRARIVDLGAGTGSMGRFLAPHLPKDATLISLDGDARLLAHARRPRLRRPLGGAIPRAGAYVSSALIDLVSAAWLREFLRRARGKPVLMCLAVDGRHAATPPHPLDASVFAAFAIHQRRWKGLGRALGPDAPALLARDRRNVVRRSDWVLPKGQLAQATLAGILSAARAVDPSLSAAWPTDRAITVGHADVLLLPRKCRPRGPRV